MQFTKPISAVLLILSAAAFISCNENHDSDSEDVCKPQCDGRVCGADGCGGVCGSCRTGSVCTDGLCYRSDGTLDTGVCEPQCTNKVCGDDGCGGLCGTCSNGQSCVEGYCFSVSCTPQCDGRECGFDGCNGVCGKCGENSDCVGGKCRACIPQCNGRSCGDDGCGGSCGSCGSNETCNDATAKCMPWRVKGALFYEKQRISTKEEDAFIPYFDGIEEVSAQELPLYVYNSAGTELIGSGFVEEDGSFNIETTRLPISTDKLFVVPLWFAANDLKIALMMASTKTPFDVWSWNMKLGDFASSKDPGDMGAILVSTNEGSGAMYLYQQLKWAYESLIMTGFEKSLADLPSMAVVWKQGMVWDCGTCYIDALPMEISSSQGKYTVASTMQVGGSVKDESAWGLPTILHEFGHYVLYKRRDNSNGGKHNISSAEDPKLAWGEGWATFYSLMSRSIEKGEPVTDYWRLLNSGSYWLDYVEMKGRVKNGTIGIMSIDKPSLEDENGMKQKLSEAWVTSVLFDLWDGNDIADAPNSEDSIALGTKGIWNILKSDRYLNLQKYNYYLDGSSGYRTCTGSDIVDFFDAAVCSKTVEASVLNQWIADETTFPYDNSPVCVAK